MVQDVTCQNSILNNELNTVFDVGVCAPIGDSDYCSVNFTVALKLESPYAVHTAHRHSESNRMCYR